MHFTTGDLAHFTLLALALAMRESPVIFVIGHDAAPRTEGREITAGKKTPAGGKTEASVGVPMRVWNR